jgi:hypothetical protein
LCKDDKIQPARGHILRVGHPDHVFHLAFHETTSGSLRGKQGEFLFVLNFVDMLDPCTLD